MDSIVFLPFAAGTMTHFERDLYAAELPAGRMAGPLVGIRRRATRGSPRPGPRPAELCDAGTKTHINDDPGPVLRLRHRHGHQVPAPRPHRPQDPQAGPARLQLLRQPRSATSCATSWPWGPPATGARSSARPPARTSARAPCWISSRPLASRAGPPQRGQGLRPIERRALPVTGPISARPGRSRPRTSSRAGTARAAGRRPGERG